MSRHWPSPCSLPREHGHKITASLTTTTGKSPPTGPSSIMPIRHRVFDPKTASPPSRSRLAPGKPFDRDFRQQAHYAPSDLRHHLPTPPPHHTYVTVGGHVVLVDAVNHIVRDVIHLHDDNHH